MIGSYVFKILTKVTSIESFMRVVMFVSAMSLGAPIFLEKVKHVLHLLFSLFSTCSFYFLSMYLDQDTAEEPFRSSSESCHLLLQSNHSKLEAIPLSAFPKDTTSELAGLSANYLNVKQESCEYKLFKSFGLIGQGN